MSYCGLCSGTLLKALNAKKTYGNGTYGFTIIKIYTSNNNGHKCR